MNILSDYEDMWNRISLDEEWQDSCELESSQSSPGAESGLYSIQLF